jgi:hypothetical protein
MYNKHKILHNENGLILSKWLVRFRHLKFINWKHAALKSNDWHENISIGYIKCILFLDVALEPTHAQLTKGTKIYVK